MNKTIVTIVFILISVSVLAETKYVSVKSLNVRSGAGSEHPVISKLTQNQQVDVISEKDGWSQIENGWIASSFLSNNNSIPPLKVKESVVEKKLPTKNETHKFIAKFIKLLDEDEDYGYRNNSCESWLKITTYDEPSYSERQYENHREYKIDWSKDVLEVSRDYESVSIVGQFKKSGSYYEEDDRYDRMHLRYYDEFREKIQWNADLFETRNRLEKAMRHMLSICKEDDPF